MKNITHLSPNQVFIFGANATGFHGAGAAGFACRGDARVTWRNDIWFLEAMKSPVGSPKRIGKWAVFGVARGFQEGREGKSYAIVTITKPGQKRTTPISEIETQIVELCDFARKLPDLEFLMTPIGGHYSGYTPVEMIACLVRALCRAGTKPDNLIIPDDLYENVEAANT